MESVVPVIRVLGRIALFGGLLILVLGEIAFDEALQLRFEHDPAFAALRAPILPRFLPGIVGVTLGAILIGLGAKGLGLASSAPVDPASRFDIGARRRRLGQGAIVLGVALSLVLCGQILVSDVGRWDEATRSLVFFAVRPPLFFASLLLGAIGCALLGGVRYRRLPFDRWDIGWIASVVSLFVAETYPTLEDWRYAFIGDEHAFYQVAYELASGRSWDMFWQAGVYSTHPLVSSFIPAITMRVFGDDFTGWKLGSVAVGALIAVLTYLAGRWLFNRTTALVASAIVATSHYLFAYSHTGHNNIDGVPPVILTAMMVGLALRRPSPLAWFLAGLAGGSSLYFFFAARVAGPMLAVGTLLRGPAAFRSAIGPAALGCGLAIAPFIARNQLETLTRMLAESATTKALPLWQVLYEIASLTGWSAVAFHWSDAHGLYISLGLLDPVSAALSAAGIAIAGFAWRDSRRRANVLSIGMILLITGGLARHSGISVPRLLVALPLLALAAGDAVHALGRAVGAIVDRPAVARRVVAALAVIAFTATIAALNLYRFRITTPTRNHVMPESMIVAAAYDERCRAGGPYPLVIWGGRAGGMATMVSGYEPETHVPLIITESEFLNVPAYQAWSCIVVHHAEGETAGRILRAARQAQPAPTEVVLTDLGGRTSALLLIRPGLISPSPAALGDGRGLHVVARGDVRRGSGLGALQEIADVVRDSTGRWLVADRGNRRIMVFDPRWAPLAQWADGAVIAPTGLAADDQGIVVLDTGARATVLLDTAGKPRRTISWSDLTLGQPTGVVIDHRGRVIVADQSTSRLVAFDRDFSRATELRNATTDAGSPRALRASDVALSADGWMALYDDSLGRITIADEIGRSIGGFETGIRDGRITVAPDGTIWVGAGTGRGIVHYGADGRVIAAYPPAAIYGGTGEGGVAGIVVDDRNGELVIGWRYQSITRYRTTP